ncbi:hypothetical protein [Pararhodobacter oceanensis]|uniref:Uncharacterized protein n=1 Tax=Pararhodobacter oceanensis TaxID=2172121 RepID=A0A2T8HQ33_9RHOB|nr:hypothetical protein [Pararhodobacter oceanensis]PVH27561.1 hypothetical protein DDE20_16620 [Pararhodobacter oceanensis]
MPELSRRDFSRTAPSKAVAPHVIPPRDAPAVLHRTLQLPPPNRLRDRRIRFRQHSLTNIAANNTSTIDTRPRDMRDCPDRPSHALKLHANNLPPDDLRDTDLRRHGNNPL